MNILDFDFQRTVYQEVSTHLNNLAQSNLRSDVYEHFKIKDIEDKFIYMTLLAAIENDLWLSLEIENIKKMYQSSITPLQRIHVQQYQKDQLYNIIKSEKE